MMHSKTQTTDTTGRADRQSGNVVCNSTFTRRQRPPRRVAQLSEENRPKVGYCPQGKRVERIPSPSKLVTPRVTLDVAALQWAASLVLGNGHTPEDRTGGIPCDKAHSPPLWLLTSFSTHQPSWTHYLLSSRLCQHPTPSTQALGREMSISSDWNKCLFPLTAEILKANPKNENKTFNNQNGGKAE